MHATLFLHENVVLMFFICVINIYLEIGVAGLTYFIIVPEVFLPSIYWIDIIKLANVNMGKSYWIPRFVSDSE